nr:beta-propeller domain-containing protein [Actinomycetota bacterium]
DRPSPDKPEQEQQGVSTAIHKFDISSPARTQYRGSGQVSGYLLSQWSLSEHRGVLRVVSTESPAWWGTGPESESFLTTLRHRDGGLVQAGRIGGLGKGERVYSVRFAGDVGYVVTFRQIDPLYTVDLAVPERPRVLGELKIPGYSAYLHPIADDLLLGIGQDASEEGRPLGTQLSLFDVSDLRRPTRLHREPLGPGWSEAESDHHAFLYWPRTGLVVVPFERRAVGYRVSRTRGIDALGRIDHEAGRLAWTPGVRRSLVVRNAVLTVSDAGVKSSSLATLAELGWAAFPPPAQPGP